MNPGTAIHSPSLLDRKIYASIIGEEDYSPEKLVTPREKTSRTSKFVSAGKKDSLPFHRFAFKFSLVDNFTRVLKASKQLFTVSHLKLNQESAPQIPRHFRSLLHKLEKPKQIIKTNKWIINNDSEERKIKEFKENWKKK